MAITKEQVPLVHIDYNLVETTFDKDTDFQGELEYDSSLKINGKFSGKIRTSGFLYVGKSARVEADIDAGIVILEGYVKGEVTARERIEMLPSGELHGDLTTASLQICDGVVFRGNCTMLRQEKTAAAGVQSEPAPVKI